MSSAADVSRSLTFLWTSWSAAASVALLAVTAGLAALAWRRSGFSRRVGLTEVLRVALVAAGAVVLNQPEWVEEYRPKEKPAVAVLWDASPSMATRDVVRRGSSQPPTTRRAAAERLADPAAWQGLRERMNVVIEPFPSHGEGRGTDLHAPLTRVAASVANLRGVVIASDGDWNEGPPPVEAAARLRAMGVPVIAVPVGSATRLPDVELLSLDAPTFGVAGKTVRVPFTVESSLPREHAVTVTLRTSVGDVVTKEVRLAAMGRTSDWLAWKSAQTGDVTLTLEVPVHADELIADNNRLSAPISIREERLRVLLVESVPRWEYRYLRNALSRDQGVEISCLLFQPGLSKVGGGNKDYVKQFPAGAEELSKFDVVFLGDVGVDDGQLTPEQCRLIKGLVEHQASGLVFMPGPQGRQASLPETELADLYPVALDPSQPAGWGSRAPSHFELTESGRRSLLTKLADTEEDNADVWEGLPGFHWYAPVARARAGSDVLCVHKDASNEHGRLPLLVTRTFGSGKVLFMGTDGAWRWRKGVEDKYHYRFWGQVVRWMAYQRNIARGESMRLYYTPDQPRARQTLALHANVTGRSGEPLRGGDVSARVTSPSGKSEVVRFTEAAGDEWGEYTAVFNAAEPGDHRAVLTCKTTGAVLEASFFVRGVSGERVGRPARPEVLEELARVTGGSVVSAGEVDEVVRSLAALPDPPPLVRRLRLWCHPAVAGGLVFLMGLFWTSRKAAGLV
jgi:hypothetical protein